MYVSNDAVVSACSRFPEQLLPGASVHPYRPDALAELERTAGLGAVLVKLLPNSHGFDPAEARLKGYYRKLADLGLCLLIHGGYEHTIRVIDQAYGDPSRLRLALDQGVTVIVAHVGTAGLFHLRETFGAFLKLLERYPNCYGDISALDNVWRAKYLKQLLDPQRLCRKYGVQIDDPFGRLVHGSDFPIPVTPTAFVRGTTSAQRRRLRKNKNYLQRDIDLKRLLGVPDACLTRAYEELGIGKH